MRDTLVIWVKADKLHRYEMALGKILTFYQVYNMAKVQENTKAPMEVITQVEDKPTYMQSTAERHLIAGIFL